MKLHMGSGTHYAPGWVNVDTDPTLQVYVLADIFALPFKDGIATHVYLGHVLEHLPYERVPEAIAEILRVSTADVRLAVVGPCMDLALATQQPQWLLDQIVEHGTPPGGHAWTPTAELTRAVLEASGLVAEQVHITQVAKPEWPNANSWDDWQCAFLARRG